MPYFLAVDAGGTKTDWLLADAERVLGRVRTGSVKVLRTGADSAAVNFAEGVRALEQSTGVSLQTVERTCIGAAGIAVAADADALRLLCARHVGGALRLQGDVAIALDAAFHGGPGVLALAGTGSNVAGRARNGSLHTRGGWGPVLADQGSGNRIGISAVRRIFLALDEQRSTSMLDAVLRFWKLRDAEALIGFANGRPGPDMSTLTPLVLRCAMEGDALAAEVLENEGAQLGYLVALLLRSFTVLDEVPTQYALAFAGSVMESVPPVRDALVRTVQREFPECAAMAGVVDPIAGALWRARDEAAFFAPVEWTS